MQKYQLLIRQLQWAISLGIFDIAVVIMTMMLAFRSAPRKGKLDRVKRIYGYLSKMSIQPFKFALKNQILLIFQGRNANGNSLSTEMQRKSSWRMRPSRWAIIMDYWIQMDGNVSIVSRREPRRCYVW
jgi:hypothetical protein